MQSQKQQNDLCSFPRQTIDIMVIQVYALIWSWTILWRSTGPFRTNTPKRCPFHYRGLECRRRKSRNTVSNRQIWPQSAEWRTKANRVLPREHTGHSKHLLPTTQEKATHGHHQMANTEIKLIIFFAAKEGEALYSQQKQDQAQIMNSLLPHSDLNEESGESH